MSFDQDLKGSKLKNMSQNLFVIEKNNPTPRAQSPNEKEENKFSFSNILKRLKEKKDETPKNNKEEKKITKSKFADGKLNKKINSVVYFTHTAPNQTDKRGSQSCTARESVSKPESQINLEQK